MLCSEILPDADSNLLSREEELKSPLWCLHAIDLGKEKRGLYGLLRG